MKVISKVNLLMLIIFLLSASLRFAFALSNRESNDNHIAVVRLIMINGKLPKKDDSSESFQPKLYHYMVAKVAKMVVIRARNKDGLILVGQLVNFSAGILLLILIWLFLHYYPFNYQRTKLWAFAFAAFNPPLIGINSQATNDTFVILFSSCAIFFLYLYLKKDYWIAILPSIFFSFLSIASKTNGLVAVIAIFIALIIKATYKKLKPNLLATSIFFLIATALIAFYSPITQYRFNYYKYATPVVINMERPPMPRFFTKTFTDYTGMGLESPGILSIQDGFLTFRFLELMKTPYININIKQPIRTSFWTIFYARAHTLRFNAWPPTWFGISKAIITNTRLIFIFSFVPTFLILLGVMIELKDFFKEYFNRKSEKKSTTNYGIFLLTFLGYIFFVLLYTLHYRTFVVMKSLFVLPAILSIVVFFGKGYEKISLFTRNRLQIISKIETALFVLLLLYFIEIVPLVIHLAKTPSPFAQN